VNSELSFTGGSRTAPLEIKVSPRAKVMRLRVDSRTGRISLTVPKRTSQRRALQWASEQRGWIEAALAEVPEGKPITPGAVIPLLGEPHLIDWRPDQPRTPRAEAGRIVVGGPAEGLEARILRWLKREGLSLLSSETCEFAAKAGVSVTRVGVGDTLSRWGSCSSSGAIRYSWRLILAPSWVRRATVAHEVAHRVHMDHSRAFHALVKELYGADPSAAREWLRREGAGLHRIGRSR